MSYTSATFRATRRASDAAEPDHVQLRQRVLRMWELMLLLAVAYCLRRACTRRGGKSTSEGRATRV